MGIKDFGIGVAEQASKQGKGRTGNATAMLCMLPCCDNWEV